MIKILLWVLFVAHTLAITTFLTLYSIQAIPVDRTTIIILSVAGLFTTLSFGELILRDIFEKRNTKSKKTL
jgi:hypothetical protein